MLSETRVGERLSIEQLLQQVVDNAASRSGGSGAGEIAAIIDSAINSANSGGNVDIRGVDDVSPMPENGKSITGFVDIFERGNGTGPDDNVNNPQNAAVLTSSSLLESDVVNVRKSIVEQASITVSPSSEQVGENIPLPKDNALLMPKAVPVQLVAVAGETRVLDGEPHDPVVVWEGESLDQHLVETKILSHHFHGSMDQLPAKQKNLLWASSTLEYSELSASEKNDLQVVVNALGENPFSASSLSVFDQTVGKNENHFPVTSDDVLNQVTMHLPDRYDSRHVVTIQLQPESLGKVEVKLVIEQQKLTAHFVVQHSEIRDILLKHVTSLHDALVAKGVEVKHVAVEIAPAEKMTGMAVNVDQHPAGGDLAHGFQQFSGGSRNHHSLSDQNWNTNQVVENKDVRAPSKLTDDRISLQPGSLHIQA